MNIFSNFSLLQAVPGFAGEMFAAATHWAAWEIYSEISQPERSNPDTDYDLIRGQSLPLTIVPSTEEKMPTAHENQMRTSHPSFALVGYIGPSVGRSVERRTFGR